MTGIIIPKAIYPSPFEDQKLYQPLIDLNNCPRVQIYSRKQKSKKVNGAFKLYKVRKPKGETPDTLKEEEGELQATDAPRKVYKLITRAKLDINDLSNGISQKVKEGEKLYYDPNEAPLCEGNLPRDENSCPQRVGD